MKIASAELQMASAHASLQHREVRESLRMWVGQRPDRADAGDSRRMPQNTARPEVVISDAGKAAAASETSESLDEAVDKDPRMVLIRMMVEALTGKAVRIFDAREIASATGSPQAPAQAASQDAANANAASGYGIEYDYHESYTEAEVTQFAASGSVTTSDGRNISFSLELSMSRLFQQESSVSLRLGDAARKVDPLVLNFSGNSASLTDQRFSFDLDANGSPEQIARLASGSGYLVFDRNGDGRVNDGREMFGPNAGDGFAELAELDDDGNGWIDESDAAFTGLQLWHPDEQGGGQLYSLADAGVGAISLSRVATPFALKNAANESLGDVRTSGIFLHEDGEAGTIQQIDLTA